MPRDWSMVTADTGVGNPKSATNIAAEKAEPVLSWKEAPTLESMIGKVDPQPNPIRNILR